jgi:hypothetical protein
MQNISAHADIKQHNAMLGINFSIVFCQSDAGYFVYEPKHVASKLCIMPQELKCDVPQLSSYLEDI